MTWPISLKNQVHIGRDQNETKLIIFIFWEKNNKLIFIFFLSELLQHPTTHQQNPEISTKSNKYFPSFLKR
jgi:hypothetical protein